MLYIRAVSLNAPENLARKALIMCTSYMSKLRLREVKELNHRNTVREEELGSPEGESGPLFIGATIRGVSTLHISQATKATFLEVKV